MGLVRWITLFLIFETPIAHANPRSYGNDISMVGAHYSDAPAVRNDVGDVYKQQDGNLEEFGFPRLFPRRPLPRPAAPLPTTAPIPSLSPHQNQVAIALHKQKMVEMKIISQKSEAARIIQPSHWKYIYLSQEATKRLTDDTKDLFVSKPYEINPQVGSLHPTGSFLKQKMRTPPLGMSSHSTNVMQKIRVADKNIARGKGKHGTILLPPFIEHC